jgi:hypothetical protein
MPSTYSTSLKIELPSTGSQSGIWGLTTNNNLGTLIEQAITGVQSIVMADANYTLTSYDGVTDEARNAVLVVTGTNTAIRSIIAPNVNKVYNIFNNTTGGYAITIKGATGTGIDIPNGVTTQVYCNGTNFYNAYTGLTGNLTVTANATIGGNLAVTGTSTFTGIPSGPTAASGTNTTQLATTAFVTTAVSNAFPSGTRLVFAQAAAPTGWTQDTSDTANNRMMRVVNTTGGGVGGSSDPTLMNVVPSHTHGWSANTNTVDINHVHYYSGTTGGMNASNPHNHYQGGRTFDDPTQPLQVQAGGSASIGNQYTASVDINHGHDYSGNTGYMNANNTHYHSVSGTTDNGSSQTNWTPRYNNVIICQKN